MAEKPQLSKHRASFARSKAKKSSSSVPNGTGGSSSFAQLKEHGFDARKYHQNANRREIKSLVKFDCPVCRSKNTAIVQLDSKRRVAIVKCGVCLSLQPTPEDLPYPYETPFVPTLENKADVFFRFLDAFERLELLQSGGSDAMTRGSDALHPFFEEPISPSTSLQSEREHKEDDKHFGVKEEEEEEDQKKMVPPVAESSSHEPHMLSLLQHENERREAPVVDSEMASEGKKEKEADTPLHENSGGSHLLDGLALWEE